MRMKYLYKKDGEKIGIENYPNFLHTGNVRGMKEKYYGKNALLVRCGDYVYNVTESPYIYYDLAH